MAHQRYWIVFSLLTLLIALTGFVQSWSIGLGLLTVGLISAVMALGLNIQWGYAGQFNAGVMGFAAIGAVACVLMSMPWVSGVMVDALEPMIADPAVDAEAIDKLERDLARRIEAERQLLVAWLLGGLGAILAWGADRLLRKRLSRVRRAVVVFAILAASLALFRDRFEPAIKVIESTGFGDDSKYLGGLDLPILLAWCAGGVLAAIAAWLIARIALGLRSGLSRDRNAGYFGDRDRRP